MAKRKLTSSEVLQAILDNNSDHDFSSTEEDFSDNDDQQRALHDTVNDDASDDSDEWVYPQHLNWTAARGELPFLYPFEATCGFTVDVNNYTAKQFYELFVSPDLIRHFVHQTNLYAAQFIEKNPNLPPHSRVHAWVDTDENEMKKFIGILMLMGIIRKPDIEMYWSTDPMYATPIFVTIMKRNRFSLLLKFFHLNDNSNEPDKKDPNRDRLFKLRPLIDHLFETFQLPYVPGPSVAVDESLLLWKGRLQFRQYLPLKKARFGIKMFCLAENSGYIYRFRVYTGKEDPMSSISAVLPDECKDFGLSEKIVVYLALPLLDNGYTIWMDNWYSSCRLFHYLHHRKTTACGTIRSNRVPPEVRNSAPAPGQHIAYRSGPLCLKFRDKKDVHMLTTQHNESVQEAPRRRGRPSPTNVRYKPQCIIEYNSNMGAVDKQDQVLEPYSAARKTMKWYKKLSVHLLQMAMLNAHILYQKNGGTKTFLQFEHDVIADFIFSGEEQHAERVEAVVRLTERHFPDKLEPTTTWTKPQARCRVCSKKGQRRDVKTFCSKCPSNPGLCAVPCFGLWHSKLKYWE
ncbi:piggyBac transposable element-derived protein 4-like [Polypterus senegalus]|uniref:piggyBac transposable element-derived protein 4-like n=1 Tax=Polypterus senegalus TaxID=55291 RepID=UPI0019638282|nr:piggyBac transposable element-derived protein 4-like [Polypterus senegalus]